MFGDDDDDDDPDIIDSDDGEEDMFSDDMSGPLPLAPSPRPCVALPDPRSPSPWLTR